MKKRLLSILLCLSLALYLFPVLAQAQQAETSYLALGDSISSGYLLPEGEAAFPQQVADVRGGTLTNLAENGETTASLLAKLNQGTLDQALAGAQVITLTIGGNDLMNALYDFLTYQYNGANPSTPVTVQEMKEALTAGKLEMLTFALKVLPDFADSQQAVDALVQLAGNLTQIVQKIQAACPNGTLVMANQYNPYRYLANQLASNPLAAAQAKVVADAFEAGVTRLNQAIDNTADQLDFLVADTYTAFTNATQNPCNASFSLLGGINLDFHPNAYGHSLIAQAMLAVLGDAPTATLTFQTNGGSDLAPQALALGTQVDLTAYVPTRAGYTFAGWYADPALSQRLTSLVLTGDQTLYAGWNPFTDVRDSDWFYDGVLSAYYQGLMTGTSQTTFSPSSSTTRGMVVTILYRLEGEPAVTGGSSFTDVADGQWYTDAVAWAAANGIVNGMENNTFAPNSPVTREQMAAILYRYAQFSGYDVETGGELPDFADLADISQYALDALVWACQNGLINGLDGNLLSPQGTATRAQTATILTRCLEILPQL